MGSHCSVGQELWDAGMSGKTLQKDCRRPGDGEQRLFQEWRGVFSAS